MDKIYGQQWIYTRPRQVCWIVFYNFFLFILLTKRVGDILNKKHVAYACVLLTLTNNLKKKEAILARNKIFRNGNNLFYFFI